MNSAPFLALVAALANAVFFVPKVPNAAESVMALPGADKIGHVLIFAFTTWSFARLLTLQDQSVLAWSSTPDRGAHERGSTQLGSVFGAVRIQRLLALIAVLIVWGGAIEFIQSSLPARSADFTDLLADACGIALGVGALWVELALSQRYRRRHSR